MKIVTWNVNSIRIRLNLLNELALRYAPEVICLQEVKAKKEDFPFDEIKEIGYPYVALYSMPGYNGVAILSRLPIDNIVNYNWCKKTDARHISAEINGIEIHNIYIPAGGDIPDIKTNPSFVHKLQFVDELADWFDSQKANFQNKNLLICGDFNIAPLDNDVWDHKKMSKIISHTPIELEKLNKLFNSANFRDIVRNEFPEPQKLYSWWSYRNPNWQTNDKGRRLDHIWTNDSFKPEIAEIKVLKEFRSKERPSDHVPVLAALKL